MTISGVFTMPTSTCGYPGMVAQFTVLYTAGGYMVGFVSSFNPTVKIISLIEVVTMVAMTIT
jgi:hypothetical protein